MILFHFTNAPAATIKAEGLRPGANSWADYAGFVVPKEPVVWLMAEFYPTFMWGKPPKRYCEVVIPSEDRKLVSFEKILHGAGIDVRKLDCARQAGSFYVYFGTITPDRIWQCGEIDFSFEPDVSAAKDRAELLSRLRPRSL